MSKYLSKTKPNSSLSNDQSENSNDNNDPKGPTQVYGGVCAGGSAQAFWEYKKQENR
jgi:hypothetical protein